MMRKMRGNATVTAVMILVMLVSYLAWRESNIKLQNRISLKVHDILCHDEESRHLEEYKNINSVYY